MNAPNPTQELHRAQSPGQSRRTRAAARLTAAMLALGLGVLWRCAPVRAQGETPTSAPPSAAPSAAAPSEQAPGAQPETSREATGAAGGHEPAHQAEGGHAAEGAAGAEGAHGAGGEHEGGAKHEEGGASTIHMPTWLTGTLTQIWLMGPTELSAAGAVSPDGTPVEAQSLLHQKVDFTYVNHHFHGEPKPTAKIHPEITSVGTSTDTRDVETETVDVGGRQVVLIKPEVRLVLASMLPEGLVISLLTALCIALGAMFLTRELKLVPGKAQTVLEMLYTALDDGIRDLIGPTYKRYLPLIATAFLYILIMNLAGLIPGWASPTANINVTAGMAIVIVLYVQYEGIRVNGFKGYLKHFMGEPWWLASLNFPIHVIGEVARVLSLSVRLFGNIFGEDVVIVIMLILGIKFTNGWVPFQFPMLFMAIFTSLVQAMVFSILASVYIALMTVHDEGHDHGSHGHGHADHAHTHETAAPAPAV